MPWQDERAAAYIRSQLQRILGVLAADEHQPQMGVGQHKDLLCSTMGCQAAQEACCQRRARLMVAGIPF